MQHERNTLQLFICSYTFNGMPNDVYIKAYNLEHAVSIARNTHGLKRCFISKVA